MASIPWFQKVCPFFLRQYQDDSTSEFYNPVTKQIDPKLIKNKAKKGIRDFEIENYMHVTKSQIDLMNRDQYLLACSKTRLLKEQRINIHKYAIEAGLARILNEMFGKK